MKAKLLERLQLMDKAVQNQHIKLQEANNTLQQANADLNLLNGCRQELVHIINLCDQPVEPPVDAPIESTAVTDEHPDLKVMGEAV